MKWGLLSWLLQREESSPNTNFTQKETLPMIRLDALVFFMAKVKLDFETCYSCSQE